MESLGWSLLACCYLSHCCFSIGFIDFIVEPTFTVLTDMTEKIVSPLIDESSQTGGTGQRRSRSVGKVWNLVAMEISCWGYVWYHNELYLFYFLQGASLPPFLSQELRWCYLCSLGWPITGHAKLEQNAPSLRNLCFKQHWWLYFCCAQSALVPDRVDDHALDQMSYKRWGRLSSLSLEKKVEYRL